MKFEKYLLEKVEKDSKNKTDNIRVKIIQRFNEDNKVTLKELLEIAKANEISVEELYEIIFDVMNSLLYRRKITKKIDEKELASGISHEFEHTKDKEIAKIIALDHLKVIPNYYSLLAKFDKE